jgi:hypothetical protein
MAPITQAFLSALLLVAAIQPTLSAPLKTRQLAGEGSAANSILSGTDNAVGYGVENAEDNTASLITSLKGSAPATKRQLAGEGSAADSILTDTDNGVGYGTENAEDNTASLITSAKGSIPATVGRKIRRQADKIANGAAAVLNAAGATAAGNAVQTNGDSVDGTLTSDAANAGAQVGSTEESTLESLGSAVPKTRRQADKIANGAAAVISAAGQPGVASQEQTTGDNVDGQLTNDAATAGAQVGSDEETALEQTGSDTPSSVPAVST